MKQYKFTKGEWYLQEKTDAYTNIIRCNAGKGQETLFIGYTSNRSESENQHNAKLCATAPQLLEMLSDMVEFMRDIDIPQPIFETYGNLMMNAENVISEATSI